MPYACLLAWMGVILTGWVLIQRDLRRTQKQAQDSETEIAGQLRVVRDQSASNHDWASKQLEIQREALRNEFLALWKDQRAEFKTGIDAQAATAQSRLLEVGEMLVKATNGHADKATEWEGNTRAELQQHGDKIKSLREAVDLLSREARLTPERWKADLQQVLGPVHTVHNDNTGTTTIKRPKYPNIEAISSEISTLKEALAGVIQTLEPPREPPTPDTRTAQQVQDDFDAFADSAEKGTLKK